MEQTAMQSDLYEFNKEELSNKVWEEMKKIIKNK